MCLGDLLRVMCPSDDVVVYSVSNPEYGAVEEYYDSTVADVRSGASMRLKNANVVFISQLNGCLEVCVENLG